MHFGGKTWLFSHRHSKELFMWMANPISLFTIIQILIKGMLSSSTKKIENNTYLLNTGNIHIDKANYLQKMHARGAELVFFIHDIIPITYPEYCSPGEDKRHIEKMNYVLSMAKGVITNSDATLCDLRHYAHQTDQTMPQTQAALLASGIMILTPGTRPIEKPYFVILSTIEPRKNHLLLLQVWRNLVKKHGENTPHLVIIGKRGWECENVIDLLERSQFLKNVITEIPRCSDKDLVTYIHHSQALLFPSFIEGFGLPLIEALTLKIPVIASNVAVFKEVAGDVPEYIDPIDGIAWSELIMEYANPSSERRAAQVSRIQNFKGPTWTEHFNKVDLFLKKLADH